MLLSQHLVVAAIVVVVIVVMKSEGRGGGGLGTKGGSEKQMLAHYEAYINNYRPLSYYLSSRTYIYI